MQMYVVGESVATFDPIMILLDRILCWFLLILALHKID